MESLIFPKALVIAAKTFADRPAVVGEILVALVAEGDAGHDSPAPQDAGGNAPAPQERKPRKANAAKPRKPLSEVQRYIIAECREELAEREARRRDAADRKRRQRGQA